MNRNVKLSAGVVLLALGVGLIARNLRDPDAAFREPPKEERVITREEMPLPVQATVKRVVADGKIEEIKEKRQGGTTTFEVDTVRGAMTIEFKIAEDGAVIKQKSRKLKVAAVRR
jgi:hypothetical protein